MLARRIGEEIKELIMEGNTKEEVTKEITRKHGGIGGILLWYDICYNSLCKEQGINRKKGEELKIKRSKPKEKRGK